MGLAGFQQTRPDRLDFIGRGDHFESIFTGIACAAYPNIGPLETESGDLVLLQIAWPLHDGASGSDFRKTGIDELNNPGTLNRYCPCGIGDVLKFDPIIL